MAEASFSQDQFSCSVCLDLLEEPVTIPCGHNYCKGCIANVWDQEDHKRVYSCPQCRNTFTPRPALCKNVLIAEMVKLQTARPAHAHAGEVECGICTGRKYKAVRSCVECLNSYCQSHLEQHENLFKDRRHNLVDPIRQLHEMICTKHGKEKEIFCRTDRQCICYRCLMDECKKHNIVTVEEERKLKQEIQKKQKQIQELRDSVKSYKRSARTAVDDSERIFTELICSIEKSRSDVIQQIRDQEKAAVIQAEGLLEQLEQEIDDLKSRDSELEQLSHTDNHIYFLQMFQSISEHPESTEICNNNVSSLLSFHDATKSISQLKEKLEAFCKEEIEEIFDRVTYNDMNPSSESVNTREQFLKNAYQLTLDSKTVNRFLCLSSGNRAAAFTDTPQKYRARPERFDASFQVLCEQCVSDRCYWEVEWSGNKGVCISVSYESISRKALFNEDMFGFNNHSWGLYCSPSGYLFIHNSVKTKIPVSSKSSRIGVYVNHSAGTLCFYSVSDKMILIHKLKTAFSQPLYPGFGFNIGSKVELCNLAT